MRTSTPRIGLPTEPGRRAASPGGSTQTLPAALGQPVAVEQHRVRQQLAEPQDGRRRSGRAAEHRDRDRARVSRLEHPRFEQQQDVRRHHEQPQRAFRLDQLGEPGGVEAGQDERGDRQPQRREDTALDPGERGQWDRVQQRPAVVERRHRVLRAVRVRRRHSTRKPGGARRVEDLGQVVGRELDRRR